jgi:hypothetical protein
MPMQVNVKSETPRTFRTVEDIRKAILERGLSLDRRLIEPPRPVADSGVIDVEATEVESEKSKPDPEPRRHLSDD